MKKVIKKKTQEKKQLTKDYLIAYIEYPEATIQVSR